MAPSHYLNQCWNIVNWTLRNKLQWNPNRNLYIFVQENALENVVWEMAAILSRPQCVKAFKAITLLTWLFVKVVWQLLGVSYLNYYSISSHNFPLWFAVSKLYLAIWLQYSWMSHMQCLSHRTLNTECIQITAICLMRIWKCMMHWYFLEADRSTQSG